MKKIYIQPATQQTKVNTIQMVCQSAKSPGMGGTTHDESKLLSRDRGSSWFDDEE